MGLQIKEKCGPDHDCCLCVDAATVYVPSLGYLCESCRDSVLNLAAMMTERNYLKEAREILAKQSVLVPQLEHLQALQEAHECDLIKIGNELHNIRMRLLQ